MQHSTSEQRPNQGENLFWGWASPAPYKDPYTHAAQGWMNEGRRVPRREIGEGNLADYGHYSKLRRPVASPQAETAELGKNED